MHQRLFHYAMIVYAFGFIAALTLNFPLSEQMASGPTRVVEPAAKSTSTAAFDCASQPDVLVVASAGAARSLEKVDVKEPCPARAEVVAPVAGGAAPKPAAVPVVQPLARQDL